jgi:hypothetical protein
MTDICIERPQIEIEITRPEVNFLAQSEESVNYVPTGQPGPQGPPGAAGQGLRFEFQQTTPSATWIVNHNLGFRPNVSVWSLGGAEMLGELIHISANQVNIYFDNPVAGSAIFS